jgi:predicted CXXCH cytochrome family protein
LTAASRNPEVYLRGGGDLESLTSDDVRLRATVWAVAMGAAIIAAGLLAAKPVASAPAASNVVRADYAGSKRCAGCHPKQYAAWSRSPQHLATLLPGELSNTAPFDGNVLGQAGHGLSFQLDHGVRTFTLPAAQGARVYRVTRAISGPRVQNFAGVALDDDTGVELVAPLGFGLTTGRFLPLSSAPLHSGTAELARIEWRQTCVRCHDTVPLLWLSLPTAPGAVPGVPTPLLPAALDAAALDAAVSREALALHPGQANLWSAFTAKDVVELGVGCEACHLGAAAHAAKPTTPTSGVPRAPFLGPGETEPKERTLNRMCARCHARGDGAQHTGEPGGAPLEGASRLDADEAHELAQSRCNVTCVACHDPHGGEPNLHGPELPSVRGNSVCTSCHAELRAAKALTAHTHHDAAGNGSACVGCHMPRTAFTQPERLTLRHRIRVPDDEDDVLRERPLTCALCHPDGSARTLLDAIGRFWGKRFDERAVAALYPNLDAPVLDETLRVGRPYEQTVAATILGESGRRRAAEPIARLVSSRNMVARRFALRALETLFGQSIAIETNDDAENVAQAVQEWMRRKR